MTDSDSTWGEFESEASLIQWRELNASYSNDKQLYHYTEIGGLNGILNSGQLWSTHMAYLNDSQEIEHGIGAICRMIESKASWLEDNPDKTTSPESAPFVAELYRAMGVGLTSFSTSLKSELTPFVTCLSRSRDQLSQWRGYANGGYSIAFDPDALKNSLAVLDNDGNPAKPHVSPVLTKVDYLDAQVYEEVERITEKRLNDSIEGVTSKEDDKVAESAQQFIDEVIGIVSRLKHWKFNEEHEYRIIAQCHETFYSESTLGLIPRAKIGFDKKSIREVIVGPGPFADLRKASIERFLGDRKKEFGDVTVSRSLVPYREI